MYQGHVEGESDKESVGFARALVRRARMMGGWEVEEARWSGVGVWEVLRPVLADVVEEAFVVVDDWAAGEEENS